MAVPTELFVVVYLVGLTFPNFFIFIFIFFERYDLNMVDLESQFFFSVFPMERYLFQEHRISSWER